MTDSSEQAPQHLTIRLDGNGVGAPVTRHLNEGGRFSFSLPYMYFFIERDDEEIEICANLEVEKDTLLKLRRGTMVKSFEVGERIAITPNDLNRIAQACFYFAKDLQSKLPVVPSAGS